jgi:iron complex transport system substrate-binding protein
LSHITVRRPTRLVPAVAGAVAVLLLAACGSVSHDADASRDGDAAGNTAYPVSTTDCGRTVTIAKAPQRIVSMHPSLTELLVRLGVEDRIAAQAQDGLGGVPDDVAAKVKAVTSIAATTPPDKETLLATEPDLVLSGTEYEFNTEQGFAGYAELEKLGVPAYVATAGCQARRTVGTVEDAFTDIGFLGRALGVPERAAELERQSRARLAAARQAVDGKPTVKAAQVYVEGGKLYALGGAIEVDVLRLAGGANVFSGNDSMFSDFFAAEVNPEVVIATNPEAFVFAVNDAEHSAETMAYLRRTFAQTIAVKEDRLVPVDNSLLQPGSLGAIDAVRVVAEGLHG